MLILDIPEGELFDEEKNVFVKTKAIQLRLEHSLVSISKWEAKWKKPFLVPDPPKTFEESIDYIRCMTLNQFVDPYVYYSITPELMAKINAYIDEERTATKIYDRRKPKTSKRDIITSEVIYYLMTAYNIPMECQKWHLSRLLTLLRVCEIKNNPNLGKMSKRDILSSNKALNEARRKMSGSRG